MAVVRALSRNARHVAAISLIAYFLLLLSLIDIKPLWLDEVIQLQGTCETTFDTLTQHLFANAGSAPLGYLAQHWLLSVAGCGTRAARFLSVIAGVCSLALLGLIGTQLGLNRRVVFLSVFLWGVSPLAIRYSLEGRPYMQGLFFALAAVLIQLRLERTNDIRWAIVLAASLSAAVFSQPFAVFAPAGFSLCSVLQSRSYRHAGLTGAAYGVAAMSFLPWLLAARSHWRDLAAQGQAGFSWSFSLLKVLIREAVGDGYPAAVPAILLALTAAVTIAATSLRDRRMRLAAAAVSGIVLALIGDAAFNYFFAIRQVLYTVPFLLLLAGAGAAILWRRGRYRIPSILLVGVFVVAAAAKNYTYLANHAEDWNRLAARLSEEARGGCIVLPASERIWLYTFFRPEIARQICARDSSAARIVIPSHSYSDPRALRVAWDSALTKGMRQVSSKQVGFATITVFGKR